MSAETIPAEVATDLDCIRWYVECLDAVAFKRRAVAGLAEAEGSYNAAMKRLTDRSTRPAEPAVPVAEAGDGEVVAWLTCWTFRASGPDVRYPGGGSSLTTDAKDASEKAKFIADWDRVAEWRQIPLVRLSTLEAERARADAAEQERDWQYAENVARIAAQGAAEQRAADALARAEKAEGENKRLRDALVMISLTDWYTRRVRQHPDGGLRGMAGMLATRTLTGENPSYLSNEVIIERFGDPRASREAQPATDGGGNG